MADEEKRPPVPAEQVLGGLRVAPLPGGTSAEAVFMLIKLDNGEWCARNVGEGYNRVEFLGQLTAYTFNLTQQEAAWWFVDEEAQAQDEAQDT